MKKAMFYKSLAADAMVVIGGLEKENKNLKDQNTWYQYGEKVALENEKLREQLTKKEEDFNCYWADCCKVLLEEKEELMKEASQREENIKKVELERDHLLERVKCSNEKNLGLEGENELFLKELATMTMHRNLLSQRNKDLRKILGTCEFRNRQAMELIEKNEGSIYFRVFGGNSILKSLKALLS